LLAVIAVVITGCAGLPEKRLETIAAKAPDAAMYLLDELKTKKIILINERHLNMNEELFLAEHLQGFYNAGVRYLFTEGDMRKESHIPIYPWMYTGHRAEERELRRAIEALDPFNVVIAEEGRIKNIEEFNGNNNGNDLASLNWLNYRDEYAAKSIIETLDNAPPNAKAIILYEPGHGEKSVTKWTMDDGTQVDRVHLGYLLSERYGSDLVSFIFITESVPEFEDEWKRSISSPKIMSPKDVKALKDIVYSKYSNIYSDARHNYYDAFIADREVYVGTVPNYVPDDDQLRFWLQCLKEYELKDSELVGTELPQLAEVPQIEQDALYLIMVYYLKLYYGDHFNYTLWKVPGEERFPSLREALEALELYAFNESVEPSELIIFHNSLKDMRLYSKYMYYSLIGEVVAGRRDITDIVETGSIQYIRAARELFPEDLWPLYWLAFIQTETGSYDEGLTNFQELFANDLSLCMSILPLAYKKAAKCAGALGNASLAAEYAALSESLYNEYGADPSRGPFSVETGYHLK
jgi:hypothetical protein